jgi:hypothetical protein
MPISAEKQVYPLAASLVVIDDISSIRQCHPLDRPAISHLPLG